MARHTLYGYSVYADGSWEKIGTIDVSDTLEAAHYLSDTDEGLMEALFLVENPVLGDFFYGGKLLSFVQPDAPLRQQIDAFNDDPHRPEQRYIPYDTPLYTVSNADLPQLTVCAVQPMLAIGVGGSIFSVYPSHPHNHVAFQVTRMAEARAAVCAALGLRLRPLDSDPRASPWNEIECAWAQLVSSPESVTDTYQLGEPFTAATVILPHPATEDAVNSPILAIYRKADIGRFLYDAEEDAAAGFHERVMATPSLPVVKKVVPCETIQTPPLLLLPDFCNEWRRLHTLYTYSFNHNTVRDLADACSAAAGQATSCHASETLKGTFGDLVLLPAVSHPSNFFNEVFIQDAYLPACLWSTEWTKVQVHCAHKTKLTKLERVGKEFQLGGTKAIEQNYGGNFVVSPPVYDSTAPIEPAGVAMGACGPAVPAQTAAPYGKIVVGDCLGGYKPRIVDVGTRESLWRLGQGAQPWLPIDVSWLSVGHADEIVSFIATPTGQHKMLLADTVLMRELVRLLAREDAGTCRYKFHVGQWTRDKDGFPTNRERVGQDGFARYDEISVSELQAPEYRVVNNKIQSHKLDHIAQRLSVGLAFAPDNIVKLPVYFEKLGGDFYDAFTTNVVNLQMTRGHLLVPRPFGPRLPADRAGAILTAILGRKIAVPNITGFWHWGFPGEYLLRIALYYLPLQLEVFTSEMDALRVQLIKNLNLENGEVVESTFTDAMQLCMTAAEEFALTISRDLRNGKVTPISDGPMRNWQRVWIPLPNVDVVEELIVQVLDGHGVPRANVHFIDSWAYHKKSGNIHCATNALATPPSSWPVKAEWFTPRSAPSFPYSP